MLARQGWQEKTDQRRLAGEGCLEMAGKEGLARKVWQYKAGKISFARGKLARENWQAKVGKRKVGKRRPTKNGWH